MAAEKIYNLWASRNPRSELFEERALGRGLKVSEWK